MFGSMTEMSSQTGIPYAYLEAAKKNGCPFVRHGRCDLLVFIRWFFNRAVEEKATTDDDDDDTIDWAKRDKKMSALTREVKLEELKKTQINFQATVHFLSKLVRVSFFGELDRMAQEFPSTMKGKDEIAVSIEVNKQIAQVKKSLESDLRKWETTKGEA